MDCKGTEEPRERTGCDGTYRLSRDKTGYRVPKMNWVSTEWTFGSNKTSPSGVR